MNNLTATKVMLCQDELEKKASEIMNNVFGFWADRAQEILYSEIYGKKLPGSNRTKRLRKKRKSIITRWYKSELGLFKF